MTDELDELAIPRLYCPLTDDPTFVYYNAASTDVQRTWRKFGWKPLEERKAEQSGQVS